MLNKSTQTRRTHRKVGRRLIAAGLILTVAAAIADIRVRPMIHKAGGYQSHIAAVRIIDSVVYDEVGEYSYDELIILSRDESGNVVSIESNMVNINRLKARVTHQINERLSEIEHSDVQIPIGTVSGFNMLYGRGFKIPVKLTPKGYANVNLVSKFTSAGINQTLHQITLTVSAEITAIIPGYTNSVEVETEFIVAQTVIVGYVPESYTHIILGEDFKGIGG
ncbi:MAG: sporulation protein YunB [Oscillospiraceae bacterium]|nr:sporulation protein YunB [Oscillospiraceae bacterium]